MGGPRHILLAIWNPRKDLCALHPVLNSLIFKIIPKLNIDIVQDFSLLHGVQTGSGTRPASYSMRTGGSILGGKAAGA
jgi:hypothetical protein